MNNQKNILKKQYWFYVIALTLLIYSTLSIVRPICESLKKITPFNVVINSLIIVVLVGITAMLIYKARVKKPSTYCLLGMLLTVYGYGLKNLKYAEEKIHFIEYGFLAFLIYKAIRLDNSRAIAYGGALILTTILGWVDEGIQYLLPNRYYQTQDVILNSLSGLFGLFFVYLFEREGKLG